MAIPTSNPRPDYGRPSRTDPFRYANPAHALQRHQVATQASVKSHGRPYTIPGPLYQPKSVPFHSTGPLMPEAARVDRPAADLVCLGTLSSGSDNPDSQLQTNTAPHSTTPPVHAPLLTQLLRQAHVLRSLRPPPQPIAVRYGRVTPACRRDLISRKSKLARNQGPPGAEWQVNPQRSYNS